MCEGNALCQAVSQKGPNSLPGKSMLDRSETGSDFSSVLRFSSSVTFLQTLHISLCAMHAK